MDPDLKEVEEVQEDEQVQEAEKADEQAEESQSQEGQEEAEQEGEAEEVVITIGDESAEDEPETRAPEWVRELRKANREKDRVIRELQAKLSTPQAVELGKEPDLEDPDIDFDKEKFRAKWNEWNARKRQIESEAEKKAEGERKAREAWNARLDAYNKAKEKLRVPDFEDAESVAADTLSEIQQGVIINGAESPETLIYVIGKNPRKAKELASIAHPVKFAFAVAKLETQLKVQPKKQAPMPEKKVVGNGSATASLAADRNLDALKEKARRTGDYTAYLQAKARKQA